MRVYQFTRLIDVQGSRIVANLTAHSAQPTVYALCRREPSHSAPNLKAIADPDTAKWHDSLKSFNPKLSAFFSALGTSRALAGSFEKQYTIDHDLNLSLAQAAKEAGVPIYVLISSAGVSATSMLPYPKMKGKLENDVKDLGFTHTVLLKPGLLMGAREDSRLAEASLQGVAKGMGAISSKLVDFWAQDADVVAKAAVAAAFECADGKRKPGVWEVCQSDIIRLGRTDWPKS